MISIPNGTLSRQILLKLWKNKSTVQLNNNHVRTLTLLNKLFSRWWHFFFRRVGISELIKWPPTKIKTVGRDCCPPAKIYFCNRTWDKHEWKKSSFQRSFRSSQKNIINPLLGTLSALGNNIAYDWKKSSGANKILNTDKYIYIKHLLNKTYSLARVPFWLPTHEKYKITN